jgi:hypothetical protein
MQVFRATWLFLPALALGGCPMYPDGCGSDFDCGPGYVCDYPSAECVAASPAPGIQRCSTTSPCDAGLVCDRYARCVAPEETGGTTSTAGKGGVSRAGAPGQTSGSGGGAGESGAAGQP